MIMCFLFCQDSSEKKLSGKTISNNNNRGGGLNFKLKFFLASLYLVKSIPSICNSDPATTQHQQQVAP